MLKNYLSKFLAVAALCLAFANVNAQTIITVAEGDNAGAYYGLDALFGPYVTADITAPLVVADDGVDVGSDACTAIMNDVSGAIAIIDRGACAFVAKALNAQDAGAIAVVLCNTADQYGFFGGDDMGALTIPTTTLPSGLCATLRSVPGSTATLTVPDNVSCARATPIEPGTHTVDSIFVDPLLGNGNGSGTSETTNENIGGAVWYAYTPSEDGVMTINSCLGGADTRLLVHSGSCNLGGGAFDNLTLEALNDDACPFEEGNEDQAWASSITRYVTAGTTYYIEWNDRWMAANQGFTFTLDFTAQGFEPAAGEACSAAIEVGPGTYTVDTLTGFGGLTANGIASEWYSFSVDAAQIVTISSCGATADNAVLLYSGDSCDALTFITANDDADGCDVAAALESFVAQPGITYWLEWSDVNDASGFDWTLSYDDIPAIDITFTVDMTVEGASDDGVFMGYAPLTATSADDLTIVPMTDNGDNTYSVTINVTAFDSLGYNFVNGTPDLMAFSNAEMVPEECSFENIFGFRSRVIYPASLDAIEVGVVCYASCSTCVPEDCADPLVIVSDDFDSYVEGGVAAQSDIWSYWSGPSATDQDSNVSTEQANSGSNSLKIQGGGTEDIILPLGDYTNGHYYLSWDMYIPEGNAAYFNMQHFREVGQEWAYQVTFNGDGTANLDAGSAAVRVIDFPQDSWFKVIQIIDINNNIATININGTYVYSWPFNWQANAMEGTQQIGSLNFFPIDATHVYYLDNMLIQQIPDVTEGGQYCATALTATEGSNAVTGNEGCFGGHLNISTTAPSAGAGAVWFSYSPAEDGVISVSSCGSDSDSRLWIVQGDCTGYDIVGANDDQCAQSNGDPYASLRDVAVTGGEQYYIVWDNRWDTNDFTFDLTFTAGAGEAGQLPSNPIVITAGEHEVATLNGNSTVGNELLGSFTTSLTLYGQSKWYSYTPSVDETVTISSCDGAGNDNVVYVHTGDASTLTSLEQVSSDDNSCGNGVAAEIVDLELTGGQTYLIEWIVRESADDAPFLWTLSAAAGAVDVTFNVDATALGADLSADGIFLAGSFNGFNGEAMTDNGDGTYSATLLLNVGEAYTYQYQNGAGNFENIEGDCTVGAFGDREVVVGEMAMVLETVCFGFCTDCATDVVDVAFDSAIEVFPNPAKDIATVSFNLDATVDLQVEIVNSLGQVMQSQIVKNASNGTLELNLTNLAAGIYTVTMTDGERLANETLVVEK